jgi:hypothetical protein
MGGGYSRYSPPRFKSANPSRAANDTGVGETHPDDRVTRV